MARWAAIIGARGTGKSNHAGGVVEALRGKGVSVGGFLQVGVDDELERRSYNLHRVSNNEVLSLARPAAAQEAEGQKNFCSFAFIQESFSIACRWLEDDWNMCSIVVIDEVSKLEVSGQGHHTAIRHALSSDQNKIVVLCIRADQLFYVVEAFNLEDDAVAVLQVPGSDEDVAAFVDALIDAC